MNRSVLVVATLLAGLQGAGHAGGRVPNALREEPSRVARLKLRVSAHIGYVKQKLFRKPTTFQRGAIVSVGETDTANVNGEPTTIERRATYEVGRLGVLRKIDTVRTERGRNGDVLFESTDHHRTGNRTIVRDLGGGAQEIKHIVFSGRGKNRQPVMEASRIHDENGRIVQTETFDRKAGERQTYAIAPDGESATLTVKRFSKIDGVSTERPVGHPMRVPSPIGRLPVVATRVQSASLRGLTFEFDAGAGTPRANRLAREIRDLRVGHEETYKGWTPTPVELSPTQVRHEWGRLVDQALHATPGKREPGRIGRTYHTVTVTDVSDVLARHSPRTVEITRRQDLVGGHAVTTQFDVRVTDPSGKTLGRATFEPSEFSSYLREGRVADVAVGRAADAAGAGNDPG